MKYRDVYFDDKNQKIRWTKLTPENFADTYNFIGKCTKVEFDLLIELLWFRYEEQDIRLVDLKNVFKDFRNFCDSIKENYKLL